MAKSKIFDGKFFVRRKMKARFPITILYKQKMMVKIEGGIKEKSDSSIEGT